MGFSSRGFLLWFVIVEGFVAVVVRVFGFMSVVVD